MKSFLKLFLPIILLVIKITVGNAAPSLNITNNGPTYIGTNLTFTATLSNYKPLGKKLTYIFDDGVQVEEHQTTDLNFTISRYFSENTYDEGFYNMNVTVITTFIWETTVASNFSRFELRRNLIGEIIVTFGDSSNAVDEVPVGENITFSINLKDPSNVLKDAIINYGWSIDYDRHQTVDNLIYNFTDAGIKDIKAIVTASLPNNIYLMGTLEKLLNAKIPVSNVNISGNPFMHHGETLNLKITCDGTPPFIYCYKIMRGNNTSENFTCTHLSSFTTCHMEILKYFQNDGRFQVGIYLSNNVREIKRVLEIMVYSVSVSPTLSTVIIPIVCSLLALVIIAGGIAYFIQQKNQMAVEVANFDFQDESDSFTEEKTFFENIFDSVLCRNCTSPRMACSSQGESDPLI